MRFCRLDERRALRADRDGIDQHKAAIVDAIQKMRAQCSRTAEVVGDNVGLVDVPVIHERGEQPVLGTVENIRVGLCR